MINACLLSMLFERKRYPGSQSRFCISKNSKSEVTWVYE